MRSSFLKAARRVGDILSPCGASTIFESLEHFRAFSPLHLFTLVGFTLFWAVVVWLGGVAKRRGYERLFTVAFGGFGLALWLNHQLYSLFIDWRPEQSLPLHVCDIAALAGPLALLTQRRWLRTVLYFWALAFTTQGLITPTLADGPATLNFWMFWVNHTTILAMAAHEVIHRDYRPRGRDLAFVIMFSSAYLAVVFPIDVWGGWNYGFVGPSRPNTPTIIDALGPWPWRIFPIILMAAAMLTHWWLPWPLWSIVQRRRWARQAAASEPSPPASQTAD